MISRYLDRKTTILTAICLIISALSIFLSAQIPGHLDDLTEAFMHEDTEGAINNAWLMSLFAIGSFIAALASGLLSSKIVSMVAINLRRRVFKAAQDMEPQDVDHFSVPSLANCATTDVETVAGFVGIIATSGLALPLTLIIVIPMMAAESFELNIVVSAIMITGFSAILITLHLITPRVDYTSVLGIKINHSVVEYMRGLKTIRTYGGEKKHSADFNRISDEMLHTTDYIGRRTAYIFPLIDLMVIVVPLVIYTVSYYILPSLGYDEQISMLAGIMSFTMYVLMLFTAMTQTTVMVGLMLPDYISSRGAVDSVLDYTPSMTEGDRDPLDLKGTIEFRDVSFSYPNCDSPVLRNINMKIGPGERIAFIGPPASGKTTMLNLIERFYDVTSGSVLVDGLDVRDYRFADLRRRISFASQDPVIFSTSLEDNIRFSPRAEDISDGELESLMEDCRITDFIQLLPEGKNTILNERGVNLSGGQKKRIGLARAICTPGDIYLLDTPFSAVDMEMETSIRDAIRRRLNGLTTILVTQRVSTAMRCERIYVFDNGEIVASGTHNELMDSCEYYAEMVRLQSDWEAVR